MLQNIFAVFMTIIAIGAGIFGWWMENGTPKENNPEQVETTQSNDTKKEI